jgi:hypothetical protein
MAAAWEYPMHSKSPINAKHITLALALGVGCATLVSCGGGGDSARVAQTIDASKNGVVSVQLEDNDGYAHFKGSLQLNLVGSNDQNVTTNLNNKATWKLSDKSLGSIKNGLFTASGKTGELTVNAEYAGLTTSQNIIVSDANLDSISITATSSSVDECKNANFTASALFDNGLTLEYPLTWAITEGSTLASFKDANQGVLSTNNSGQVRIVARGINNSGEIVNSDALEFSINDTLTGLTLTANRALEMREGDTATLSITGTYSDSSTAVITDNSTITANPSSAVTLNGATLTAKSGSYAGTDVELSGSCGGVNNTLDIKILKKEISSIEIKNSNGGTSSLSVTKGGNLDLNVTATFTDNGTDSNYTHNIKWSIDESKSDDFDDDMITLDQTGLFSVSSNLNLALNQQLRITVRAEVVDNGTIVTNPQGQQLMDVVEVTVRP